jgi:hypothetical protein
MSHAGVVQASAALNLEELRSSSLRFSFNFRACRFALVRRDIQQAFTNRLNLIRVLHLKPAS